MIIEVKVTQFDTFQREVIIMASAITLLNRRKQMFR